MHRGQVGKAGRWAAILLAGASLCACATPQYDIHAGPAQSGPIAPRPIAPKAGGKGTDQPYQVGGIWYVPHDQPNYDEKGIASWYGDAFNMKATADGEVFDMDQLSAAHTTLPLPSMVEVTNLDNGRKLTVRVNDRGPFVGGRIIDLSHAAAQELGYERAGTAHVRVRYVGPAPLADPGAGMRYAKASPVTPGPMSSRRPADEDIFEDAAAQTPAAATPLVRRPEAVSVSTLAPCCRRRGGATSSCRRPCRRRAPRPIASRPAPSAIRRTRAAPRPSWPRRAPPPSSPWSGAA